MEEIPELKRIIEGRIKIVPPQSPSFDSSKKEFNNTQVFCTCCGQQVLAHAAVCLSCGATPIGHRKYCRNCGVQLNEQQVVCIKCGTKIGNISHDKIAEQGKKVFDKITNSFANIRQETSGEQLNRQTYILLAMFAGGLGIHDLYAKRYSNALMHFAMSIPLILLLFFTYSDLSFLMFNPTSFLEMPKEPPVVVKLFFILSPLLYIASHIRALVSIGFIKKDGDELPMKE